MKEISLLDLINREVRSMYVQIYVGGLEATTYSSCRTRITHPSSWIPAITILLPIRGWGTFGRGTTSRDDLHLFAEVALPLEYTARDNYARVVRGRAPVIGGNPWHSPDRHDPRDITPEPIQHTTRTNQQGITTFFHLK